MEEKDALPKLGTEWDEDDDVDDDDNTTEQGQVMLGFVYEQGKEEEEEGNTYPPLFTTTDWMSWDGGKVGGKPIWLNRKDLPSVAAMECGVCGEIMKFLLQIYCPVDGIEEAFHRAIYVICCRKKACIERHCLKTRSVKVFRCQLPRNNQFYPYDSSEDGASVEDLPLWSTFPKVCRVCGFKATKVCSRCNQTYYCSREHQKVDFPEHKATCLDERSSQNSNGGKSNQLVKLADNIHGNRASGTFNFPEYEIYVEPESLDISESETKKNHGDFQDLVSEWEETAGTQDGAIVEDEDDGDDGDDNDDDNTYAKKDEDLTQKDYSEALGNKAPDPLYRKFLSRIRKGGGNQILRYFIRRFIRVVSINCPRAICIYFRFLFFLELILIYFLCCA